MDTTVVAVTTVSPEVQTTEQERQRIIQETERLKLQKMVELLQQERARHEHEELHRRQQQDDGSCVMM